MTGDWQFFAAEITTGNIIYDLPLTEFSGEVSLLGNGAMSANLPLAHLDSLERAQQLLDFTRPGRCSVLAARDGVVRGEWVIWGRQRSNDFSSIQLSGNELLSVADHRQMPALTYTGKEQLDIARDLVMAAFGGSNWPPVGAGAVQLDIAPYVASGQPRDRTWVQLDGTVGQRLRELAEVDKGFDIIVTPAWRSVGTQGVTRSLRFAYPYAGTDLGVIFDMVGVGFTPGYSPFPTGGNILSFAMQEDGTSLASRTYAIGEDAASGTYQDIALVTDGWPFYEAVASYSTVSEQGTLNDYAKALWTDSQRLELPIEGTVLADSEPGLDDFSLGDTATIHLDPSVNFPQGYDGKVRITGWTLKPPEAGPETIVLTTSRLLT
jgi:hypothetical protein